MKKIMILAVLATAFLTANAQEADRFVGSQHVRFQTACHPQDVMHYDTKTLRDRFVMERVMESDSILLTYSHYDPFHFRWRNACQQNPQARELLRTRDSNVGQDHHTQVLLCTIREASDL